MDRDNSAFPTNQSMSTDYAYLSGGLTKYEYVVIHIAATLATSELSPEEVCKRAQEIAEKITE